MGAFYLQLSTGLFLENVLLSLQAFTRYKYRNFSLLASLARTLENYYYIFPTEQTDEINSAVKITIFFEFISVLFCVRALDSLFMNFGFEKKPIPTVLHPKSLFYRS